MSFAAGNTKASKLTGLKVVEIREKYATGDYTQARLAREYQVSLTTIRNVLTGVTWQTIPRVKSEEQVLSERAILDVRAKESEQKFRLMMGITDDPPPAVAERFADDLAKAVELNNELEGLKK